MKGYSVIGRTVSRPGRLFRGGKRILFAWEQIAPWTAGAGLSKFFKKPKFAHSQQGFLRPWSGEPFLGPAELQELQAQGQDQVPDTGNSNPLISLGFFCNSGGGP
jgi:hypothetical protein